MKIFNFLKKIGKIEEEKVIEIKLEDLDQWVASWSKKIVKQEKIENVRVKIDEEKKKLEQNLQRLIEAELENPNIPQRHKDIRESNRKSYVRRVSQLLDKIDLSEKGEELLKFCKSFDDALDYFGDYSLRNYRILQEFFVNIAGDISRNISTLNKLVKKLKFLLESARIQNIDNIKNEIREVPKKIKIKKDIKEKINILNKEIKKENKQIKEIKNLISEHAESNDYKGYLILKTKKKVIENEIKELESTLHHFFAVIQTALKKYERLTLENKLVRNYLDNPLRTLLKDNHLKIISIIENMNASIRNGDIDLKEKKKSKILHELEKINKRYFIEFLNKYRESNKKLVKVESELDELEIIKLLQQFKENLRNHTALLEGKNNESNILVKKLERINDEALLIHLEKSIKNNLGHEIKIIS